MFFEEGLSKRIQFYATDVNETALHRAKSGFYSIETIRDGEKRYRKSGGKGKLSDFFLEKGSLGQIQNDLKKNIVFAHHNLVTDEIFGHIHLIFCRNVLLYFSKKLKDRAFRIFEESLVSKGFIALGIAETMAESKQASKKFEIVSDSFKIYQKRRVLT